MSSAVTIDHVTKTFGSQNIWSDVTLTLPPGEISVLLGPSGTGDMCWLYSQKNTAHGGEAAKAIDGNKNGSFGGGGQTHTAENTPDPWWEVDLGDETPIDHIAIYNRTDDGLGC